MGITDELRKWGYGFCGSSYEVVNAIADRIDAEHQKAMDEWKARDGQTWLKGYSECREELMEGNEVIAASLEEVGWIRLPLDADGVPIRIGDVLDEIAVATYPFVPAKVVGYHERCGEVLPIVENDGEFQVIPEKVCHYHEPTVEDVLREMLDAWGELPSNATNEAIVAEYAAKLRLADDGKEQ